MRVRYPPPITAATRVTVVIDSNVWGESAELGVGGNGTETQGVEAADRSSSHGPHSFGRLPRTRARDRAVSECHIIQGCSGLAPCGGGGVDEQLGLSGGPNSRFPPDPRAECTATVTDPLVPSQAKQID